MKNAVCKSIFLMLTIVLIMGLALGLDSCNDKPNNDDKNEITTSTTATNNQSQTTSCKHDNPEQIIIVEAVAPTCQRTGLTGGMQCKLCGTMVLPQTIVPSLNHNESNWIVDRKTTISEAGLRHTECTMCGKMLQQEICQGTLGLNYVENNGKYTVSGSPITDHEAEIIIPATYNGIPVTSIGSSAFGGCSSLTNITIPDSITSIGSDAFGGCSSLTNITIPDSVMSIGSYAFYDCRSLTSVTIPDSVTSIGSYAFDNCSSLTSITIPDSVTSIGSYAFAYCDSLASVTIGNSVTSIGSHAFDNCSSLTSITIPDSVTSIGSYAFSGCDSLTSITIGNGVTTIGNGAFYNCSNLTSITFEGTVAEWNSISFGTWWYRGTPAIKLICSNGVFRLE